MDVNNIAKIVAPRGQITFAINLGNPVLARQDEAGTPPYGVSVDIGRALSESLGVSAEFLVVTSARQSVEAVADGRADIGFFAIQPERGDVLGFTEPYLNIEGWYAVRESSDIRRMADVDQPNHRIAVSHGSAYDLHLSRALKQATLIRTANPQAVTPTFLQDNLEVMAGVRQQLEIDMQTTPGLRLLPERFMVIEQSIGFRRSFGSEVQTYLTAFIETLKETRAIESFLAKHAITGAVVAPPRSIATP